MRRHDLILSPMETQFTWERMVHSHWMEPGTNKLYDTSGGSPATPDRGQELGSLSFRLF